MREQLANEKYGDGTPSELSFIHIGKCGGATVGRALQTSPVVAQNFGTVKEIHIRKPFYQKNAKYLVVVRNPLRRVVSAFNWRYHLVVETRQQEFRFTGEYEVLKKYGSIINFAEALYVNGVLSLDTVKDWLLVHHLREDISFYLRPLLDQLRSEQVFAVLAQESLNRDIEATLAVKEIEWLHEHQSKTAREHLTLSAPACVNLRRFLADDYHCLKRLSELHPMEPSVLSKLLS